MKKNVGKIDKTLRIVVGVIVIGWGIATQNWIGAVGIVPLLTGVIGWCPAYCPFGISTSGKCEGGSCSHS